MKQYKKLLSICTFMLIALLATAQTGSNSPYTRYGIGQLSDQRFGNSKAMGGMAYGLRNNLQINAANPASYSAVDSLTFIFDAGMSLQNTNFSENGTKTNAKNSTVDYIAMQFRLFKNLGITAGFLPYSTVGYNMSRTSTVPNSTDKYGQTTLKLENYSGEGGIQQIFLGLGYKVFKNLSIGANLSYLYGDISHSVTNTFSNENASISSWTEKLSIKDYKLDLGIQYTQPLGEKHAVTLGAVYSPGHDLNSNGYRFRETYSSSSVILSQRIDTINNACGLPESWGIGVTYNYNKQLTVGMDYTMQKWEDIKFPVSGANGQFASQEGQFSNRSKIAVGMEYHPNAYSRNFFNRVRYRMGAYYSTPYAKVDGKEGANEYGVSFGFGLPIFQSRSVLNISGQYVKINPKVKGMLEENSLRVNVGLTFNERWFMKWKVD